MPPPRRGRFATMAVLPVLRLHADYDRGMAHGWHGMLHKMQLHL